MGKLQGILFAFVIITFIAGTASQIIPAYQSKKNAERELAEKTAILEQIRGELTSLQQEIYNLEHLPAATEKIAREKFNYCGEGEIIYLYTE